jgi:hypothetical protein
MTSQAKLDAVVKSWIDAEETYSKGLADVMTLFVVPLRGDAGTKKEIIPREALPVIFGNIELLSQLSRDLLQNIKANSWNPESQSLTDPVEFWNVFLNFIPQLQTYRQYVENYDLALQTLNKYLTTKKMTDFLAQRSLWRPDIDLLAQLKTPTHHIRDLSLFVARAEKLVSLDDAMYHPLSQVSLTLAELNQILVEARTDAEHLLKLKDIEKRVSGLDSKFVSVGRRVIREGWLEKVNPKGKVQRRWFILLNDQMIWAASNTLKAGMALRGTVLLNSVLVKPMATNELGFEVVRMDKPKNYPLLAESVESKNRWMADITSIVERFLDAGRVNARLHSTETATASSTSPNEPLPSPRLSFGPNSSPASDRRSVYKSGAPSAISNSRLSLAVTPLSRGKGSAMPTSHFLSKNSSIDHKKLDLVDASVSEELRNRFQTLVSEVRDWPSSSDRMETSLLALERRLKLLETRRGF